MRRNWPQAFRAGPTEVGHALEHSMNIKGGQAWGNETGPSAGAADTAPANGEGLGSRVGRGLLAQARRAVTI